MDSIEKKFAEAVNKFTELTEKLPNIRSRRPYYTYEYGELVKRYIDTVTSSGNPLRISAEGGSVNTMRRQYYEGLHYLKDKLDPDGKYKTLSKSVACRTAHNYIELYRKVSLGAANLLVAPAAQAVPWRDDFILFIQGEHAPNTAFRRKDVILSQEDIDWAKAQLEPLGDLFLWKVETNAILIIKT